METKELMVGDLITINVEAKEFVAKAICIDKDIVTIDLQEECTLHYYRAHREVNPIPLTEEILLANGFSNREPYVLDEEGYAYYQFGNLDKDNKHIWFWYKDNEIILPANCTNWIYINYVHQLQHALRLCGLNDLADNFKIK